jgi:methylamine dehydrogenase heavy chain
MTRRIAIPALAGLALAILAQASAYAQFHPDRMKSYTLSAPSPHWAYVLDPEFVAPQVSKIQIVDTDSGKLLGQVDGGYLSNFEMAPDHRQLYMIDTFYSRAWHGTRTDAIEIFDASTLKYVAEVQIPPKRLLIVPKINTTGLSADGRFLYVANLTPSTSVSVVDIKARKFIGEIETPGCVQVLPAGDGKFASMCADGSLLTVGLDAAGKLKERKRSKPFFDPEKDPVFDQPVQIGSTVYFDTYHGMLYEMDLSGDAAVEKAHWPLLDAADRKENWRPGGWQTIAASADGSQIYVLMHQGGEWTHKEMGKEVWAYDARTHRRLRRIKLKTPAYSIRVSGGAKPELQCLSLVASQLETYRAADGKSLRVFKGLGTPFLIYGP